MESEAKRRMGRMSEAVGRRQKKSNCGSGCLVGRRAVACATCAVGQLRKSIGTSGSAIRKARTDLHLQRRRRHRRQKIMR
jgi:hypothetical protein